MTEMLLSAVPEVRGGISKYTRLLRYSHSLNSSLKYSIRERKAGYITAKRSLHYNFWSLEKTCDRNKNIYVRKVVRVYGRFENVHLRKTRSMVSRHEPSELNTSEKESNDLSFPFWIFLWSFLAVIAGFIYSKLNKQKSVSGHESGGNHNVNDEQIASKFLSEIQKKDSPRQSRFRRQGSYEIIDGEVRIHYEVPLLDDTVCSDSTNIDSVLKRNEVQNIPLQSTRLDDLDFINPGKLSLIVEEGDEDLLDVQIEEQTALTGVYKKGKRNLHEGKKSQERRKLDTTLNCRASNFEGRRLHFEGNRDEITTHFHTITQETLIPTWPTVAINEQNRSGIDMGTDNCDEVSRETETDLTEIKNEMTVSDSSDFDESSLVREENVPTISILARNGLHNPNTDIQSHSVHKLTQIAKTLANQLTVTRKEFTQLKNNKEKVSESDFMNVETSFPIVVTTGTSSKNRDQLTGDNNSQVSLDSPNDTELIAHQGIAHVHSNENIDIPHSSQKINIERDIFNANEVTNLLKSNETATQNDDNACLVSLNEVLDNGNQKQSGQHKCHKKEMPKQLPSGDVYEYQNTLFHTNKLVKTCNEDVIESLDLTYVDENSDILVDGSGDVLLKGVKDEKITKNDIKKLSVDENFNFDSSFGENKLNRNWQSLPSWVGSNQLEEFKSDSSDDVYNIELRKNVVVDMKTEVSVVEQCAIQNVGEVREFVSQNNVKETCLETFENRIGTRKAEVYFGIDESEELSTVAVMLNSSSSITTVRGDEIIHMSEEMPDEISKPDKLMYKISDDILVAENVQERKVEAERPLRGKDDKEYSVVLARASEVEEDVLLAKIVTAHDPVCSLKNSDVILGEISELKRIGQNHTKVCSIAEKFELVRKPKGSLKEANEDLNLERHFDGGTIHNESGQQTFGDALQPQSQGSYTQIYSCENDDFSVTNCTNNKKSEQAIVTTPDENGDSTLPDGETNINSTIDDTRKSGKDKISCDSLQDSDSPSKFNCNTEVGKVEEFREKNPDDAALYASHVIKVNASDSECCVVGEPGEAVYARQIDDCNTVVYASQICDSGNTLQIYCEDDPKQLNDNSGLGKANKNNCRTTVVYANHINNSEPDSVQQPIVEINNSSHTKVVSPRQIKEQGTIGSQEHSDMASSNLCITPSQDSESRSFRETSFDAAQLTSSPVANTSLFELQEKLPFPSNPEPRMNDSLHENKEGLHTFATKPVTDGYPVLHEGKFPSCSPVPQMEILPELQQDLPQGETDVDNFSDIDEIDISVVENYKKSKSVTDLDEALASCGRLDHLSNKGLEEDSMSGCLSKSVPDILDSCREEFVRESVMNPAEKKNLSLSTPEINSKTKSGTKKVTKIKIVHVKFLEMPSDCENVEEDSFTYEGELPITGKMKRRSGHFSNEYDSPVVREIAQEPWTTGLTNLKQAEFEFGDLSQKTPLPASLKANEVNHQSSCNQSSNGSLINTNTPYDTSRILVSPVVDELPVETMSQISSRSYDSTCQFSGQSLDENVLSSSNTNLQSERTPFKGSKSSTAVYNKTSTTSAQCSTHIRREDTLKSDDVITTFPMEVKVISSTGRHYDTIQSNTVRTGETKTKIDYKNIENSSSLTSITSETQLEKTNINSQLPSSKEIAFKNRIISKPSKSSMKTSFKYSSGSKYSYSTEPKPVAEHKKCVVKSGIITTQNTNKQTRSTTTQAGYTDSSRHIAQYTETPSPTRHFTTQVRYINNPSPSSSSDSYRHGIKLSEKFHMSDERNLTQILKLPDNQVDDELPSNHQLGRKELPTNKTYGKVIPTNQIDDKDIRPIRSDVHKTKKTNQQGQKDKYITGQSGRLVTVKSGMISDCSSDADSEMSYSAPSPRVKAKRSHRPQIHRVASASSSEPDSPRRQMKSNQQSMSELFGVDEYHSDTSGDGIGSQKLCYRFGNFGQSVETIKKQDETFFKSTSSCVCETKPRLFNKQTNKRQNSGKSNANIEEHVNPKLPSKNAENISARDENMVLEHPKLLNTYQTGGTAFYRRSSEANTFPPPYINTLERNLSPTSFIQEGNLGDDEMSPRTIEFNPFDDREGQDDLPNERCHSPSSVYSDTSSVFSFNCDFDPMPAPKEAYEQDVYTCENPMCRKMLLGPDKTSFKSCPACFTYYCNSKCRKLHWPSHKQSCYFGRVNTYARSIIRLCQKREDLSMNLSQLARDGFSKKGRGVVMAIFNNEELAREFITKGHDAFSDRKPTYSSLAQLHREGIISKHRVALMQAVRDYEPNQEFVFNIAVVATGIIPITPAPRYKLNTVLHCIKMPLNDVMLAKQPRDHDKVEIRLFALPKCSRHEFVNEMEARRHYCRNLSKNLRQYNIKLKEDYPECYKKLCMYVEHNISFEPVVVYGQRGGVSYKCIVAPERSYPLNAEYC